MKSSYFEFHTTKIAIRRNGDVFYVRAMSSIGTDTKRVLGVLFAICIVLGVYGYGRSIWAHAEYTSRRLRAAFSASAAAPEKSTQLASAYVYALRPATRPAILPLAEELPPPTAGETAPAAKSVQTAPLQIRTAGELYIGKLSVRAPIVLPAVSLKAIHKSLGQGVVVWPGSGLPGEGGTMILLGHSSAPLSYRGRYGAVFSLLGKLEKGDRITVNASGRIFAYAVRDRIIIDPKKSRPDLAEDGSETLVLVSCWPVGTNWQRIAVRADRIE